MAKAKQPQPVTVPDAALSPAAVATETAPPPSPGLDQSPAPPAPSAPEPPSAPPTPEPSPPPPAVEAPPQPDESPEVEVAITIAGIRCPGCGRDCVPRIRRTRPARMQREGTCPFCAAHLRMSYRANGTVENVTRI